MRRRGTAALGIACAIALVTAACGSDDEAGGGGGSTKIEEGATIKVGVLASLSGQNQQSGPGFRDGVKARLDSYKGKCNNKFDIVEGDDQSNEAGNLAATQKLVEQDKVFTVLTDTQTFGASTDYLQSTGKGIPVIGYPFDGPSTAWFSKDNNFFKVVPIPQKGDNFATTGQFFKEQGATSVASVAFNLEPAIVGMDATEASVKAAGLKSALKYGNISLQDKDVSGAVSAIMASKADGVWAAVTSDVGTQLVIALNQAGFKGVINLPIGYGGDLLKNQNQAKAAEGVTFGVATAPVEIDSDATKAEQKAFKDANLDVTIPTTDQTAGYLTADLLLFGLEKSGCTPTSQEFIDTVRGTSDFDGGGLLPKPMDYGSPAVDEVCQYFVTLKSGKFEPASKDPICGNKLN